MKMRGGEKTTTNSCSIAKQIKTVSSCPIFVHLVSSLLSHTWNLSCCSNRLAAAATNGNVTSCLNDSIQTSIQAAEKFTEQFTLGISQILVTFICDVLAALRLIHRLQSAIFTCCNGRRRQRQRHNLLSGRTSHLGLSLHLIRTRRSLLCAPQRGETIC